MNNEANIFNSLLENLNITYTQPRINVAKPSFNRVQIDEILDAQIEVADLECLSRLSKPFLDASDCIQLFLIKTDDASKIVEYEHLNEKITEIKQDYSHDEIVRLKIRRVQKIVIPLEGSPVIEYCLENNFAELILQLIDYLGISDLQYLENKIRIIGPVKQNINSSIFSFSIDIKKIDSEYINFIQTQSAYDKSISYIPSIVSLSNSITSEILEKCMINALTNIFDNRNQTSLLIIKQAVKELNINNLTGNLGSCYEFISRINMFIFNESSSYREKLRIVRNIIYDCIDEEGFNNDNYDERFWEKLLKISISEYDLYVDEKVTKFIAEKKEIIKEQFSMSKEISNQISETKKSLMNNIVSVIGIFLSKFIFDAISQNDEFFSNFSYLVALMFSVYLLVMYFVSGEFKSYQTYVNRVEIMNTYYPKLYLTKDNIIGDLEKKISNPEIKRLKYVNRISGCCYAFFVILFLQKIGFFNFFAATFFTPDS
ncbi:hypothetical protein [Enterococcus casseliflavus]|uniref:hypothetical protein n=1 Tax=Enterococcus casseliflavus TaxID=37734 RepID=UPI0035CBC253